MSTTERVLAGELIGDYQPGEPGHDFAVLFVHGLGSVRHGSKSAALAVAAQRRGWPFATFDLRGHGETGGDLAELRPSRLLEDLETIRAYLATRGHRRLLPVGSSMGGFAVAWFAKANPQVVPACVLLAAALEFPERRWASLSEAEKERWRQTGRLRVVSDWIDAELGYGIVEERLAYSFENLVAGWNCPVRLVHGRKDQVIPWETSRRFFEAVPDAELELYSKGDHRLNVYATTIAETSCEFFRRVMRESEMIIANLPG